MLSKYWRQQQLFCRNNKTHILPNKIKKPKGYWKDFNNVEEFLVHIKRKHHLINPNEWEKISKNDILLEGGGTLLGRFSLTELKEIGSKSNNFKSKKPSKYWEEKENIQNFISQLSQKYNLKTPDEWNTLSWKQIQENGGAGLLSKYSLFKIKSMACPEIIDEFSKQGKNNPKPSKYWENEINIDHFISDIKQMNLNKSDITATFIRNSGGAGLLNKLSIFEIKEKIFNENCEKTIVTNKNKRGYWNNKENIDLFINSLRNEYSLITKDDWKLLTTEQIKRLNGGGIFSKLSLHQIKCLGNKEIEEDENIKLNKGYWDNNENINSFLLKLESEFNLTTPEDWDKLKRKQIENFGGAGLLKRISLFELKSRGNVEFAEKYKNYVKYNQKPKSYWDKKENIDLFLLQLKNEYNLNKPEDWYKIKKNHLKTLGGYNLLNLYNLYEIKCLGCSEYNEIYPRAENIQRKPNGFWNNSVNVNTFIGDLQNHYQLYTADDWNNLTYNDVKVLGGSGLLSNMSLFDIKCLGCPDVKVKFSHQGKNDPKSNEFWDDLDLVRAFFDKIKKEYNLINSEDWYRLSKKQIHEFGGSGLYTKYSLFELLNKVYPNENWKIDSLLKRDKRAEQRFLFLQVQKVFPGEEIVEDYFHEELTRISGSAVQFDVFLPKKNIAFEYHGQQHYEDIPSGFAPLEMFVHRDKEKEQICIKYGIRLCVVPYWWDSTTDSLIDLLSNKNV